MPLEKNTLARILGWVTTRIAWVVSVFELRKYSEKKVHHTGTEKPLTTETQRHREI
jgi:hypothetical protein